MTTSNHATESDVLVLDAHTLQDLEVFASTAEDGSIFAHCNRTRTEGGARALRRRMERPWSQAGRIRATQAALASVLAQREIFEALPTAYLASGVERYLRGALPIVPYENPLEFGLGVASMWMNDYRYYTSIARGVEFSCRLIRTLRNVTARARLDASSSELVALLDEVQALLTESRLARVPEQEKRAQAWRVLRLDQLFRLHEQTALARLLQLSYEVDALVALADVTHESGFVMPEIEEGPLCVHAQGLVHPFVAAAVGNPVELDQHRSLLFLTGPNMAGKTTYLRAFATALYLAHLGMGVPAERFRFVPAQRLFSSISLSDDLHGGVSYFRAEALRVKTVAQAVAQGFRVIAVMDEPFKGTNVKDAFDASQAILQRLASREECLFMFSSHLIELHEALSATDQIDFRYFEAHQGTGRLSFDYRLRSGVSTQRLGMRVLHEEGVFELLDARSIET